MTSVATVIFLLDTTGLDRGSAHFSEVLDGTRRGRHGAHVISTARASVCLFVCLSACLCENRWEPSLAPRPRFAGLWPRGSWLDQAGWFQETLVGVRPP